MPISMPNGKKAGPIDRIMLMAMWVKHLKKIEQRRKDKREIIAAGMGKPTFSINGEAVKSALSYWANVLSKNRQVQMLIESDKHLTHDTLDSIVKIGAAIDYDNPQGNDKARELFANASSHWYDTSITPNEVMFNVGGAASLYVMFKVLKNRYPKSYIITPNPYYSLYKQSPNQLQFIDVMQNEGFKLTAKSIENSLAEARASKRHICAILICDPNNPLSTIISPDEWKKIAKVLKSNPEVFILLDEAYAEMQLNGEKYKSLLTVAPELRKRIIIFRSATKGLSAAGERMAATLIFDPEVMQEMVENTVNIYGHAPVSSQIIYATAMSTLIKKKALSTTSRFHKKQVDFVLQSLSEIGINIKDSKYSPEGTFYVLCDLSELYCQPISKNASKVLNKNGLTETDEDIAYNLLFKEKIMIAPLSYFGVSEKSGYFRITCSEGIEKLNTLMSRISNQCLIARKVSQGKKLAGLFKKINILLPKKPNIAIKILIDALKIIQEETTQNLINQSKSKLEQNKKLDILLSKTNNKINKFIQTPCFFRPPEEKLTPKFKPFQKSIFIFQSFEKSSYNNWCQYMGCDPSQEENIASFKETSFDQKLAFVPWDNFIIKFLEYNSHPAQTSQNNNTTQLVSKL